MRWGQQSRQVVLQRLTQNTIKRQVWTWDVLLCPVVLFQFLDLGPQAVKVLQNRVCIKNTHNTQITSILHKNWAKIFKSWIILK